MSLKKQVYISCPLSIPQQDLTDVVKKIRGINPDLDTLEIRNYVRGTAYNTEEWDQYISKVDAFIIVLPGLAWSMHFSEISAGVRREINVARESGRATYLAYKAQAGWGIYQCEFPSSQNRVLVKGISGTSHNFAYHICADLLPKEAVPNKPKVQGIGDVFKQSDYTHEPPIGKDGKPIKGIYEQLSEGKRQSYDLNKFNDALNEMQKSMLDDAMKPKKTFADHAALAQKAKLERFATAYGAKSSSYYDESIEKIRMFWVEGVGTIEIAKRLSLNIHYVEKIIEERQGLTEWRPKRELIKAEYPLIPKEGFSVPTQAQLMEKQMEEVYKKFYMETMKELETKLWWGESGPDRRLLLF